MNKEFNNTIINQNYGFTYASFELSDFFQLNIHNTFSLYGEVFFIVRNIRSVQPQSSDSDFIENRPTRGGKPMSLSMYKNTIPFIRISACNAYPATCDLNRNGIAKTISREDCLYAER